jgi:hypothetical protein
MLSLLDPARQACSNRSDTAVNVLFFLLSCKSYIFGSFKIELKFEVSNF